LICLRVATHLLEVEELIDARMLEDVMTTFHTSESKPETLHQRDCIAERDILEMSSRKLPQ
jgi:hypothetical protein